MNPVHFIDISWKLLFFISISSTILFLFNIVSFSFLQRIANQSSMQSLKTAQAALLATFVGMAIYLGLSDQDIIADCFNQFASQNGVFGITRWIGLTWLSGAILLLSKDLIQYAREFYRLNKTTLKMGHYEMLNNQEQTVKIPYNTIETGNEAVVAGLWFPEIYIPQNIRQNEVQLKYILAHESIHFKNKDGFWNFLAAIIVRLNWFNPLAYIAFKMNHQNLEMATDEQAITEYKLDIHDYAKHLVTWVSTQRLASPSSVAASDEFKQIQSRLLHLKNMKGGLNKNRRYYALCLFITSVLGMTQAFASINRSAPDSSEVQMCFQVKHELIIENWIQPQQTLEPNKCE